jgi:hypothetical protein
MVAAAVMDAQGEPKWFQDAVTGADGLYVIGGAPATTTGEVWVMTPAEEYYMVKGLTFVDPGTSTCDVRPGRLSWSLARGGPWRSQWRDLSIEVAGLGATGAPVYANAYLTGLAYEDPIVTGWAPALPADVRCVTIRFRDNELAVWDAADPGNAALPLTAGATMALPAEINEAAAFRVLITRPSWRSGKPGTVVRLALENFPEGMTIRFAGEGPNAYTTWGGKTYTSTGPERQVVSLAIPTKVWPGYTFWIVAEDPALRYQTIYVGLADAFQVCTLRASKTAISRGSSVELSGVVPVEGHEGTYPGKPKYVWIYRRTTARSEPPAVWDATAKGWKLVARVRTDGLGRYHSALLTPTRTTWYVARYAGDEQYFRAYTSVLKVRVD